MLRLALLLPLLLIACGGGESPPTPTPSPTPPTVLLTSASPENPLGAGTYLYRGTTVTIPGGLALVQLEQYETVGCDQPACRPDQECEEVCTVTGEYLYLEFEKGCAFEFNLRDSTFTIDQRACMALDKVMAQVAAAHELDWTRAPSPSQRRACERKSKGTEYDAEGNETGYHHCSYVGDGCLCVHGEATPPPPKDIHVEGQLRQRVEPGRYHTSNYSMTIPPNIPDDFGVFEVFDYWVAGCAEGTDPQDCCGMNGNLDFYVGETRVGNIFWDRTEDFSPDNIMVSAYYQEYRPLLETIAATITSTKFIC